MKNRQARQRVALGCAEQLPRLFEHGLDTCMPRGVSGIDGVQQFGPFRSSAAIASHDNTRVQAAASSSANGKPSTCWQISMIDAAPRTGPVRIRRAGRSDEQARRIECFESVVILGLRTGEARERQ